MVKHKVFVADLKVGMYVCELDRPWLDTPFLFQGFPIESEEQIEDLRHYCEYVYVDPVKGEALAPRHKLLGAEPVATYQVERETGQAARAYMQAVVRGEQEEEAPARRKPIFGRFRGGPETYRVEAPVEQELPAAKRVQQNFQSTVDAIVDDIRKGRALNTEKMKEAMSGMAESVIRNPDALLWLTRLKEKDSYSYGHAVDVSIYMMAFGRHLGFPKDQLERIGLGALLLDVGKLKLPHELLEKKNKLDADEYEVIKAHVLYSMDILGKTPGVPPEAIEMTARHHERLDGKGYPRGLEGESIGIFGSMAGIVDCFNALTSRRPYATATSPFDALQMLYGWRGTHFHAALVEQFIQCLGIFPAGSLVELNTGEVGIVVEQNRIRRLKPRLMLILDPTKTPYANPRMLDLLHDPKAVGNEPYSIVRALEPGEYGVDAGKYFL